MSKPTKLFRTTIVVWTEFPTDNMELSDLGWEAESGEGFCSHCECEEITDQELFPDTEFFDTPEE